MISDFISKGLKVIDKMFHFANKWWKYIYSMSTMKWAVLYDMFPTELIAGQREMCFVLLALGIQ